MPLAPAKISEISAWVGDYIEQQQRKYRPLAYFVPYIHTEELVPFFPERVLANSMILNLETRLRNPPFYRKLKGLGLPALPDFRKMAAVTFVDVVISYDVFTPELLFHEFVHVVQYEKLGVQEFACRYVAGFLKGGSYQNIPLERNAYALQRAFEGKRTKAFSVEDEVQKWLQDGRI